MSKEGGGEEGEETSGRSGIFFGILSGECRTDHSVITGVNGDTGGEEDNGQSG